MKAVHIGCLKTVSLVLLCLVMVGSVLDIILFSHQNNVKLTLIALQNNAENTAAYAADLMDNALVCISLAASSFESSADLHSESSLALLEGFVKTGAKGRFWITDADGLAISNENMRESRADDPAFTAAISGSAYTGGPALRDGTFYAVAACPVYVGGKVTGALICEIPLSELCPAPAAGNVTLLISRTDGAYDGGSLSTLLAEAKFTGEETIDYVMSALIAGKTLTFNYWIDSARYTAVLTPAGDTGCSVLSYYETGILGSSVSQDNRMNAYISVKIILTIGVLVLLLLTFDGQRKKIARLRRRTAKITHQLNEVALMHSGSVTFEYNIDSSSIRITDDRYNILDLPGVIANVPNSLILLGIVHPNFNEIQAEMYQRINAGEDSASCELKVKDREGIYRWYRAMLINLRDEKEAPTKAIGVLIDIDGEKAARQQSLEESRYRYALISSSLFAFRFDLTCKLILSVYASDEARRDFYPPENYTTSAIDKKLIHPDDIVNLIRVCGEDNLWRAYRTNVSEIKLKTRIKNIAGEWVGVSTTVRLLSAPGGASVRGIAYVEPDTETAAPSSDGLNAQQYDALTDLYSRARASELVDSLLMYPISSDELHALLLIRISGLSEIGELSGEEQLNRRLLEAAAAISADIRSTDIIARLSDDSFAIFLKNIKSCEFATGKAEALCAQLSLIAPPKRCDVKILAYAGVVFAPRDGMLFNDLITKAESALTRTGDERRVSVYNGGESDAD